MDNFHSRNKKTDDIKALTSRLMSNNGMAGLELLSPSEIDRATQIFYRDGFVVIQDVLTPEQVHFLRDGCEREANKIIAIDPKGVGNRGPYRYSYGGASLTNSVLHKEEWVMLVDLPTVTPIITSIFGSANYHIRRAAGDFCLPGAIQYQPLHTDIVDNVDQFHDPRGITTIRDLPCPAVCCNFLAQDFTSLNGPTRQIPGTQQSHHPIPKVDQEPEWMKYSTVCPAPAGSVLIRDLRAWHGGTPNVTETMRAIPNAIFLAPWFHESQKPSMPRDMFDLLSEHGRRVCQYVVTDEKLKTGYKL
jgi:ectoine hydroxylase-related dioxygenase (phytanoyl-CoA dioxygenase family)|tara:strand:+ start:1891 stop:2799 length:909 start_codon:yes stop_codon:yes gene_type:complete